MAQRGAGWVSLAWKAERGNRIRFWTSALHLCVLPCRTQSQFPLAWRLVRHDAQEYLSEKLFEKVAVRPMGR